MKTYDTIDKQIDAQITISAGKTSNSSISMYDDDIEINVYDKSSGVNFLELHMTREQFINVVMNRLAHTEIKHAIVRDLHKVGKTCEAKIFEFELPKECEFKDKEFAVKIAKETCPKGWIPVLHFSSQDSFFTGEDDKRYARTRILRWV